MIETTEYFLTALKVGIYGCSFFSSGTLLFLHLFSNETVSVRPRLVPFIRSSSLLGLIFVTISLSTQIVWLSGGELSSLRDWDMLSLVLLSSIGQAQLFLCLAFILIFLAPIINHSAFDVLAFAAVPLTYALSGHTGFYSPIWLLKIFIIVHLSIACFWIGSFIPLLKLIRHEKETAASTLERFGLIASRLVPFLLLSGIGLAGFIAGGIAGLATNYGLMLLAKVGLVTLLLCFAALNKLWLVPQFRTGHPKAAIRLRRSITMEILLVVIIFGVTAMVTTIIPPEDIGHRLN